MVKNFCAHLGLLGLFSVTLDASAAQPGALLAIMTAGAYCSSMAGNYNARTLVAEVAVVNDAGDVALCRKRQTWEALVADEVLGVVGGGETKS